jgi:hypothetical protein
LQAFPFECGFSEPESVASLALSNNPAETLFDEGLQGGSLSVGHFAGFLKEAVWYLYGRFHMADHITAHSNMSRTYRALAKPSASFALMGLDLIPQRKSLFWKHILTGKPAEG